jgi:3-oxoacyl-[acyl-carrier-protein] synthase-3
VDQEDSRKKTHREDTTTTMGSKAAEVAIARSGVAKEDIDFVVFLH